MHNGPVKECHCTWLYRLTSDLLILCAVKGLCQSELRVFSSCRAWQSLLHCSNQIVRTVIVFFAFYFFPLIELKAQLQYVGR